MKERMKETLVAVIKCKTSQRLLTGNVFPSPFIQLACVVDVPRWTGGHQSKGGKKCDSPAELRNCPAAAAAAGGGAFLCVVLDV
jgi:hypothetical protein